MANRILKTVIAGAGIAGLTAALHLAEKGYQVILADKTDVTGGLLPVLLEELKAIDRIAKARSVGQRS